jgi:hypothetical protein
MYYTKNISLRLLRPYQVEKEILLNENSLLLDSIISSGIISRNFITEPDKAEPGDKYIISGEAQGIWADKTNAIAVRLEGNWAIIDPKEGMLFWVIEEKKLIVFSEGNWQVLLG